MAENNTNPNDWEEIKNEILKVEKWKNLFEEYKDITYDEAKQFDKQIYSHAAHAFIWSKTDTKLWNLNKSAFILMQMRFDGLIGFPGNLKNKFKGELIKRI